MIYLTIIKQTFWVLCLTLMCAAYVGITSAKANETVTLQLKWKHQFQFAGYYAAIKKGFYLEEGLDVILVEGKPGGNEVEEVLSGRANFGVGMSDLLLSKFQGKPVVLLANIFQHSPVILLTTQKSGYTSPQDLFNKNVQMVRGSKSAELQAMFLNEGVAIADLNISVPRWDLGNLVSGEVDAIAAYVSSQPYILKDQSIPSTLISPVTYGIDFYGDNLFTSEHEIAAYPERAESFRKASLKGWQYALENSEEIIELILSEYAGNNKNLDRDFLLNEAASYQDLILPKFVKLGHTNPGRWKHIADTYVRLGMADKDYSFDGFFFQPEMKSFSWDHWAIKLFLIIIIVGIGTTLSLLIFNRRLKREILAHRQTEKELKESNEKYLNLLESLGNGVVLHAPDTSIILSNPKASEVLGISPEQMKGTKVIDPRWRFVRNDGSDMPLEEYPVNKALNLMKSFSEYLIGIKRPDRKYITWVNVNASLVFDENNNVKYVTISFNDTTEQKQAEQALKESEEKLNLIINASPVGICTVDPLGNFSTTNQAYEQMVGYSKEECRNLSFFDVTHPNDRPKNKKLFQSMFTLETTSFSMKKRYIRKDGSEIDVAVQAIGITDADGNIRFGTAFVDDITERKRAEESLKESEAKLTALFTSLTEMVVMHEVVLNNSGEAIDYRITDCNKIFTEVTGIRKADAIGKLASKVYQADPPPYLEKFAKVALGGPHHEFTTYYPPLDKHFMISVVSPQAGKFATITTDISDMMQIQEIIMEKSKEMENYLYIASHDLRTPLVNIQGFSQRLKKQADSIKTLFTDQTLEPKTLHQLAIITDEDIPKTLSFVLSNIEKMNNLINGLLQLSRTGSVEMNIQEIDMNALLAKILQSLDYQIKETQSEINVVPLPGCYGDAALLDQLFTNIISNALKYSDSKRALKITVDAKKTHNSIVYTIRDTGKGIAQKYLDKIWDVFYRIAPRSDKTGEGLGLSLVKRIAEKHKGKVWAESDENKGSVFHIELHNRSFTEF